jgi:hypothetical protein
MSILTFILYLLLYALVAVLVIELICYILGLFLAIPPKVKQLLYAIVGVVLLIYVLQFVFAPGGSHLIR